MYAKTWRLEHGEVRAETRILILKIRVPRSSDFSLSGEWNPVVFRQRSNFSRLLFAVV